MKLAPIPRLYLGTMTFAWGSQTSSVVDEPVALEMVRRFAAHNERMATTDTVGTSIHSSPSMDTIPHLHNYIDTARIYAGGKTEPVVGAVLSQISQSLLSPSSESSFLVGTKAHPSQEGGLSPAGIQQQLKESTEALHLQSSASPAAGAGSAASAAGSAPVLHEYYLHQPDTEHSLLESLECLHQLKLSGVIQSIGMSNYHASEMQRAFDLCKEHSLTPPVVYQGLYNPLNRAVEQELLPVLKANQCSFVAYNPLAAGLLAGKHTNTNTNTGDKDDNEDTSEVQVLKGRFQNNPNYLPRFYTQANFDAIALIRQACEANQISMVEATYRWMLCHSALAVSDGLLLGASSLEQLDQNLAACAVAAAQETEQGQGVGALPDDVLQAFEEAWVLTEEGAFPYWRSYSADMPNRESLDQGASYDAAKKK
jgi:aflatoxin B1 aldehyde reductase